MAHDWKKFFTPQQLALIDEHTTPKDVENSTSSRIEDAEESEITQNDMLRTCRASSRWARWSSKRDSAPGGSSISSSCAGEVDGEASLASSVSSGSAAKVEMVEGAMSHAESDLSAVHIAGGVIASIRHSLPLSLETEELIEAAQRARMAHLRKVAETDLFDRRVGNSQKDAMFQLLLDITQNDKNKDLLVCRSCDFVGLKHVSHQVKGQHGIKHYWRCRACDAEYCSWQQDNLFCMRL